MNSSETFSLRRRSAIKMMCLSVLVPTVSKAVGDTTFLLQSEAEKQEKSGFDTKKIQDQDLHPQSQMGQYTLIASALLGLDSKIRDDICSKMDNFFEEYIINPLSQEYGDTIAGSAKMLIFILVGSLLTSFLDIEVGNAGTKENAERMRREGISSSFLDEMLMGSLIAPLLEETAFRVWLPKALSSMNSNTQFINYYSSLIFGFVHNLTLKGFNTAIIPAPQIWMGFFFFYLKERRDIRHNVVAHSAYNGIFTSIRYL